MNKGITFILFIFLSFSAFTQENITFSKVIKTDSLGQKVLFSKIREWFASDYNNSSKVIQMEDKDAGIIIGKALFNYSLNKPFFSCYSGTIKYTIKVYVKDNRFKVILTDFIHKVNYGNNIKCELGIITTSEIYTTKGPKVEFDNRVWKDIKVKAKDYSERIFNDLENFINVEQIDDNW